MAPSPALLLVLSSSASLGSDSELEATIFELGKLFAQLLNLLVDQFLLVRCRSLWEELLHLALVGLLLKVLH